MRGLRYAIPLSTALWLIIFVGWANAFTVTTTIHGNATIDKSAVETVSTGGNLTIGITPAANHMCTAYKVDSTWTDGVTGFCCANKRPG